MDINTHETPPGGWAFRQVQTGWSAPTPIASTHDQTVILIIKHRLMNPALVAKHKLSLDPKVVSEELMNFNRVRLGIPKPELHPPSFFQSSRSLPEHVVAAAGNLRRAAQGTAVVLDWLASGGAPVEQALAERRAAVCVECPKNQPGDWYTTAPAEIIKSALEARKDLRLATPYDDRLKSCAICRCMMRLKVWTPLDFILQRTKPEIMEEFPPICWIAKRDQ